MPWNPALAWGLGEEALGHYFILVVFTGGMEAKAPVEAFRAVLVSVVAHRQPVLSPARSFFA